MFSDAATRFHLMLKALSSLQLRQTTGMVENIVSMVWLGWPVPDPSTPGAEPYGIADQATMPEAKSRPGCPYHQAAEIPIRVALTNRFSVLGSTEVKCVAWTQEKGAPVFILEFLR